MTWGIVASVGGAIIGGSIASSGAKDAAQTQAQAGSEATAAQERMFNQQLELQEPWRQGGMQGLNTLLQYMGMSPQQAGGTPGAVPATPVGAAPAAAAAPQFGGGLDWNSQVMDSTGSFQMMPAQDAYQRYTDFAQRSGQPVQTPTQWWNQTHGTSVPEPVAGAAGAPGTTVAAPAAAGGAAPAAGSSPQIAAGLQGSLLRPFAASDFQADPGYAFVQQQGEQGLARAAQAGRGVGSGKYLKDAMRFNTGLGSQEYSKVYDRYRNNNSDIYNRLSNLAGLGQTATNAQTTAAGNFGSQIGSNILGIGNTTAAGQVGAASGWNNAIGQGVSLYQQNQMLNRMPYYGQPITPGPASPQGDWWNPSGTSFA